MGDAKNARALLISEAQVFIAVICDLETEPLPKGSRLGAWSSYSLPDDRVLRWVADENLYQSKHERAVKRNFLSVNPHYPD